SENSPAIIELMFAIWAAERGFGPLTYKLHAREMAQKLDDSGAALVLASPKIAGQLTGVTSTPIEVIGCEDYQSRCAAEPSAVPRTTDPG
ncbi:AMP-dependent synthetase, partial [Enterococcus faecium]